MNTPAENIIEEPFENIKEATASDSAENQEEVDSKASSEFALKLVNAVKSLDNDEQKSTMPSLSDTLTKALLIFGLAV